MVQLSNRAAIILQVCYSPQTHSTTPLSPSAKSNSSRFKEDKSGQVINSTCNRTYMKQKNNTLDAMEL